MLFDFNKLRGRIIEKYGSYVIFAEAAGISKATLSGKLSNKVRITSEEMVAWSSPKMLDIPPAEIPRYFLSPKV